MSTFLKVSKTFTFKGTLLYGYVNLLYGLEYFLISLSSQKSRVILVKYLDKYPLFTTKFLNYKD